FFPWAVVFGQANTVAKYAPGTDNVALAQAQRELLLVNPNGSQRMNTGGAPEALPARAPPRQGPGPGGTALPGNEMISAAMPVFGQQEAAGNLARIAFYDILIFFGVLLVGFAYLWKRGDINWVRSIAAEKEDEDDVAPPPQTDSVSSLKTIV